MSTTTGQVAVFWDYENCRPPSNASGYSVMGEIRKVAQRYGLIKTCRGYADFSELGSSPRSVTLRSELQCSGLSMIDCPHNGRKNVADQMMIVDMLTFAIDNEGDGSTIVLISGDRDFAYPVSILRFRMCQVIVISPTLPGAHLSLRSQASTFLDWTVMVNSLKDDKSSVDSSPPSNANIPLPPTSTGAQNNGKSNIHNVTNLRPQTKHSPEAFPPASRNEVTERKPLVAPAAIPDNTPPVYAATANTAGETAPPTTPPPAGNHVHELAPVAKYVYDGLQRQATLIDESTAPPLAHLPSVSPTTFSSLSCQSQSDAEGLWTIPLHLRSLVRVLQKSFENGTTQPLRAIVAAELEAQDSKVYENAGVTTFWELFRLAIKESLVWWGEQGDDVWVALHPCAILKLQLLEDDSPLNAATPMASTMHASPGNKADAVPITMDNTPPVYAAATIVATDESATPTSPPSAQSPEPARPARCADDGLRRQVTGPSDEPLPPSPPALTAASPLPLSAPSPPQGQLDATTTWTVPFHLRSLVRILQKHLENGTTQPLRSIVAAELEAQDSKVYENAGVTTFWELFRLAVRESLVWYGGQGDNVWVALRHSAAQRLQSLKDDSPLDTTMLMPSTTPPSLGNEAPVVSITVANTPVYAAVVTSDDSKTSTAPRYGPATWYANDESQQPRQSPLDEPLPPPPVPAASPLSSSDPPSSQSRFDATAWAVPLHFRSLVRVLQKQHENGNTQVRSTIAAELVAQDSKVYENAGVTTFWELVGLAVRERLVWCGGHGDDVWITLNHSAAKDSQSLVDESPLDANITVPPTVPFSPRGEAPLVDSKMNATPPVYASAGIAATNELASPKTPPPTQDPGPAPAARSYNELQNSQITGLLGETLPPPPVPTPPSLTSRAPSLSQSQSDATAAWTVPLHLQSLVRVLQKYHENGATQPLRSTVAAELEARDNKVYENAGVTTFWGLFRLAVKEKLVWWGNQGDDVWVALRDSAVQKLQSLVDDSPLDAPISMPPATCASPRNEAHIVSTASATDNTQTPTIRAAAAIAVTGQFASPAPPAQDPESTPAYRYAYDESQNQKIGPLDEALPPPLVPAPPSPYQSHFITPDLRAVPPHLRSLVLILHKHRERGETHPLRGSIAYQLVQQDSEVYSKAGVTNFKDFLTLAVREGLVAFGGTMDGGWVSLRADPLRSSSPITMDSPSPVPAAPSLSSSAPTSSQSQSSMPEPWTVPPHLRSLVLILQKLREGGENQPSRSSVAIELVKQDKMVYQKAGVTKFKSFADLAVNARLVCLGGTMGDAWISLHHDAVNKLRSNPLI
ncbi:hypothetical protein PQX77_001086 [Marasmius sp. AFHP31]|nr:hypothetical protein PQX77_001086 [Marasmius sp. AFHP31]